MRLVCGAGLPPSEGTVRPEANACAVTVVTVRATTGREATVTLRATASVACGRAPSQPPGARDSLPGHIRYRAPSWQPAAPARGELCPGRSSACSVCAGTDALPVGRRAPPPRRGAAWTVAAAARGGAAEADSSRRPCRVRSGRSRAPRGSSRQGGSRRCCWCASRARPTLPARPRAQGRSRSRDCPGAPSAAHARGETPLVSSSTHRPSKTVA